MKQRRHYALAASWPARILRLLRFDRNPLRRRTDRLETILIATLITTFAAGLPVIVHAAGNWESAAAIREARVQQSVIHLVPATLLQTTVAWGSGAGGAYPETRARWTAPDGQARTSWIFAPSGGVKGSTVPIWVTQSGQLSDPPLTTDQIQGRIATAEGTAVAALAITLAIAGLLARRELDKRRMAAWDTEWLANGPRWSPRRR